MKRLKTRFSCLMILLPFLSTASTSTMMGFFICSSSSAAGAEEEDLSRWPQAAVAKRSELQLQPSVAAASRIPHDMRRKQIDETEKGLELVPERVLGMVVRYEVKHVVEEEVTRLWSLSLLRHCFV